MCNPHASSPPPHTGDGVWAGPCSHKQRCHWATPPHPTCAPWSKSWWLSSLSKQDLFSLTSKDLRTRWHPLLVLLCHLFSSKSLASLYTWHGTVPSAPPFLETSSAMSLVCTPLLLSPCFLSSLSTASNLMNAIYLLLQYLSSQSRLRSFLSSF